MQSLNYLLAQKDKELLRRFKVTKKVQIKLFKLQPNVGTKGAMIFLHSYSASTSDVVIRNPDDVIIVNMEHNPLLCHVCLCLGTSKCELKKHFRTQPGHKRFKCEKCSYQTNRSSHFKRHTVSQHSEYPESRKRNYPCQLFSKSFFTVSELRVHLSTHTKEKPFSCQFCSKGFPTNSGRNGHEITCVLNPKRSDANWVERQKRFECEVCCKKFLSKVHLSSHMKSHTMVRLFECDKCYYTGASAGYLKSHVKNTHDPNRLRSFACQLCSSTFFRKSNLYVHISSHTKEISQDAVCEFCQKQFSDKSNRIRHQVICKLNPKQSDEEWIHQQKKFKCELCEYTSVQSAALQIHLRSHTGHKPFKCTLCEYAATAKASLYQHLRKHTAENPFKCRHCGYRSKNKSNLKFHVKRHYSILQN